MNYWTADPSAANTTNFCNFNNNGNSNNNNASNELGVAPISSDKADRTKSPGRSADYRTIGTYDRSGNAEILRLTSGSASKIHTSSDYKRAHYGEYGKTNIQRSM